MQLFGYLKQDLHEGIYCQIIGSVGKCRKDLLGGKGNVFERNYLRYVKAIKNLDG